MVMSDDIHYDYIENLNLKIYPAIRKYKKDLSIFLKFYKIVKDSKPSIIHSWSSMCSIYALPAARMLGIKFVNGFLRNAPPHLKMTDKEWIRAKLTFPFSDIIAANSFAGLKAYKVPAGKSVCLHNGFDFSRIEGLDAKEIVKKKFNIHTRYIVGMVATFSENKDYQTFVDAAQFVLEKRKDVTFMAIGDGEYLETIKKRIKPEF
jgi:glycosyltransferase involved in cell wall biosynthesis